MDDGHSAYAGLTVTNLGTGHLFRAEGQIIASNRPANYPKGVFRLGWGNGAQSEVAIPQHASDRILIGSYEDVTAAHSIFKMCIWKRVGEESHVQWWAQWLVEDKDDLPYFLLKVRVIAEGTRQPWVQHLLLTPKTRLGPLGLTIAEMSTWQTDLGNAIKLTRER